jgi:thiol-disulfide isomerase/thioredoxin
LNHIFLRILYLIPFSHKYHQIITNPHLNKGYDFGIEAAHVEVEKPAADSITIELSDILLFNKLRDTVILDPEGRYTLLETWNEKCPPCLKAMHELKPFYASAQFNQKYVYVRPNKKNDVDFEKLYASDIVSKKIDSHLVDYNEILYNSGIKGTPCFLLFDPSGKLVFKHLGYSSTYADDLKKSILSKIKKK